MFDVGFSELIVIGIVALVVIGPERLPKVARTAGHLLGRLQRYVGDVKADISREMQLDELKKLQAEMKQSVQEFETTLKSEVHAIEASVEETAQSARIAIDEMSASVSEAAKTEAVSASESTVAQAPADGAVAALPPVIGVGVTIGEGNTPTDDEPPAIVVSAAPAEPQPQPLSKA